MNLKICLSHVFCWRCGSILVSYAGDGSFESFQWKIFFSLNSANSVKISRENSIITMVRYSLDPKNGQLSRHWSVLVLLKLGQFSPERAETGSSGATGCEMWIANFNVKAWKTIEHKLHKICRSLKFCKITGKRAHVSLSLNGMVLLQQNVYPLKWWIK